jgi:hypothetical protein
MSERTTKTLWHLLLVAMTLIEYRTATTSYRRRVLAACAGYHTSCAIDDWRDC